MNSKYRMFRSYSLAVAATLAIGGILADNQVDFFVDEITSDGVGHVDPGYLYRSGGYPRTAKVQFEYSYWNFCRKMDDTTSSSAAIFGFWDSSKGGASGMRAHKTGEIVLWHGSGSTSMQNEAITGAGKEGWALAELDYLGRKATWSKGSAAKTFDCELSLPSDVVTVPYRLCALQNTGSGYMGIHSFKVFEQMEENGAVELVRSYVLAVRKEGRHFTIRFHGRWCFRPRTVFPFRLQTA
jgi:tRNA U38,U39,U40 pseudouridine synthase TruA